MSCHGYYYMGDRVRVQFPVPDIFSVSNQPPKAFYPYRVGK